MRRFLKWGGFAFAALFSVGAIGYAATPGYHRALTPGLYGLTKVADNLHIDDPARAEDFAALVAAAEAEALSFFGALRADPIYVVCTQSPCQEKMGLRPVGLSVAGRWILIAPNGFNEVIVTHERIHSELHSFMGPSDLFEQRFPAWFDEGLAGHLSGDTRYIHPENPRDADWIKAARSFKDWGRLHPVHPWRKTYGAAATLVAEIEAKIGRRGLRKLILAVADGGAFDTELERALRAQ